LPYQKSHRFLSQIDFLYQPSPTVDYSARVLAGFGWLRLVIPFAPPFGNLWEHSHRLFTFADGKPFALPDGSLGGNHQAAILTSRGEIRDELSLKKNTSIIFHHIHKPKKGAHPF